MAEGMGSTNFFAYEAAWLAAIDEAPNTMASLVWMLDFATREGIVFG